VEDNIKDSCHCGFYFLYLDRCSKNKLKKQKKKLYKQDTVSAIQCRVLHHGPTNKPLTYWKIDLKPCKLHDWQILYIFEPRDNLIITHLREKKKITYLTRFQKSLAQRNNNASKTIPYSSHEFPFTE
jgi:hypothetical protein